MRKAASERMIDRQSATLKGQEFFKKNHSILQGRHHSHCLFNRTPPVPALSLHFDDGGALHGEFTCSNYHQGYDGMVHGGILAAIIDASMAQCLMGHGVVAYTANLSIRYHKPVTIHQRAHFKTIVEEIAGGKLYSMRCDIIQKQDRAVRGNAKFFSISHL
ncbi:MAG: hypothetical protein GF344_15755 [Chitinivibrionales bacterium]|nr:hypothetical protein [Chitinivibrionales bacterium]MBD3358156.1 hypothetical protein [Chitinivibrionales bacterium]